MTTTRFADLLTPLVGAPSIEEGLVRTLRRVVALTGAAAGAVVFSPSHAKPIAATAGPRNLTRDPAGRHVVQIPLGASTRPVGRLTLVGRGRALKRAALPPGFGRELGTAIEQVWQRQRRTLRTTVLTEITRLLGSSDSLDDVLSAFANGLARLVDFDAVAVSLLDAERGEFEVLDVTARTVPGRIARDVRLPLEHTLLERVVASGGAVRVDDLAAASVPAASRATLRARGWRSAALVPLVTQGGVFGAVSLVAARPGAFDDDDVESAAELAQPLASAIEQRRLLDESRRRAEELAALYATSQLITARLDVASVLDRISRSVTALIGSTGCGIGLLDATGTRLVHAAAHGYKSEAWRALALPVGEGLMGRCAEIGQPIRVDDVRRDPRSARRDVDEREGIRSMLCVPLRVGGTLLGVISAFSTRPAAFSAHHQRVLEAFAEQAGISIQNAQLFEQSVHRQPRLRAHRPRYHGAGQGRARCAFVRHHAEGPGDGHHLVGGEPRSLGGAGVHRPPPPRPGRHRHGRGRAAAHAERRPLERSTRTLSGAAARTGAALAAGGAPARGRRRHRRHHRPAPRRPRVLAG